MANDKVDIAQYVPEFYESVYGETNIVTLTATILEQILNEIKSRGMNDWTDPEVLEDEFKASEVMISSFNIPEIELLKSFFRFKGTVADLEYVVKMIGYDSVVYSDGGFRHRDQDGNEEIIDVLGYGTAEACEIKMEAHLNLNDPNWSGYESTGFGAIKTVVDERINVCSHLEKISVYIDVIEYVFTGDEHIWMVQDTFDLTQMIAPFVDYYFEEYTLDPILYGREFNHDLMYGEKNNYYSDDKVNYGRDKFTYFSPISDHITFKWTENLIDSGSFEYNKDKLDVTYYNKNADSVMDVLDGKDSFTTSRKTKMEDDVTLDNFKETLIITKRSFKDYEHTYNDEHNHIYDKDSELVYGEEDGTVTTEVYNISSSNKSN